MFPSRYFASRYFPDRYFPAGFGGSVIAAILGFVGVPLPYFLRWKPEDVNEEDYVMRYTHIKHPGSELPEKE